MFAAVQMVSSSTLLASSNAGFLTAESKPRSAAELAYNQRSGVFSEIIDAIGGKDTSVVNFVRHDASDPGGAGDETCQICGFGHLQTTYW